MLGRSQYKDFRNTSKSNPLYADFWKQQEVSRKQILDQQTKDEIAKGNDYDRMVQDQITKALEEAREQERRNGTSGDFLNDMKWGIKYGNEKFIEPFNKYITPLMKKYGGERGRVIGESSEQAGSVIDKLV